MRGRKSNCNGWKWYKIKGQCCNRVVRFRVQERRSRRQGGQRGKSESGTEAERRERREREREEGSREVWVSGKRGWAANWQLRHGETSDQSPRHGTPAQRPVIALKDALEPPTSTQRFDKQWSGGSEHDRLGSPDGTPITR